MARPGRPERNRPDHSTSVGDSVTSSTRMRFSAHTGGRRSQCCPTVINIFYQAHCWQGMRDSYLVENTAMSLSGERVFLAVRQARLGRESHWQSPVLRKDRHKTCNARGIRSLSGAASRQQLRKETGHDCVGGKYCIWTSLARKLSFPFRGRRKMRLKPPAAYSYKEKGV